MGIHLQQALSVGQYLVTQRLKGRKKFPPGADAGTAVSLQPGLFPAAAKFSIPPRS